MNLNLNSGLSIVRYFYPLNVNKIFYYIDKVWLFERDLVLSDIPKVFNSVEYFYARCTTHQKFSTYKFLFVQIVETPKNLLTLVWFCGIIISVEGQQLQRVQTTSYIIKILRQHHTKILGAL